MELVIRKVEKDENLEEIVALVNASYANEDPTKGWTSEQDYFSDPRTSVFHLQNLVQKEGNTMLIGYLEGKLVASVFLQTMDDHLILGMLSVAPGFQDRKLGKRMLLESESYAIQNQIFKIKMKVIEDRHTLKQWYLRSGYSSTGATTTMGSDKEVKEFALRPVVFEILEKQLSNLVDI